jgi:hypothetical protein
MPKMGYVLLAVLSEASAFCLFSCYYSSFIVYAAQYRESWPPTDELAAVCQHFYDANILCQKRIAAACKERDGSATQLKRFGISPRKCLKPLPYQSKSLVPGRAHGSAQIIPPQNPENADPWAGVDPGDRPIPGAPLPFYKRTIDIGPDPIPGSPSAAGGEDSQITSTTITVGAWKILYPFQFDNDAACLMNGSADGNYNVRFIETKKQRVFGILATNDSAGGISQYLTVESPKGSLTFKNEPGQGELDCRSAFCHTAYTKLEITQWNLLLKTLASSGQPPEPVEAMLAIFKTDFGNFKLSTNGFPAALHRFIDCVRKLPYG